MGDEMTNYLLGDWQDVVGTIGKVIGGAATGLTTTSPPATPPPPQPTPSTFGSFTKYLPIALGVVGAVILVKVLAKKK